MNDLLQQQRDIVHEHMRLESAHDWRGVDATFASDGRAFFDAVPFEHRFKPTEAYQILSGALPDVTATITAAYDVPGSSIREVTLSGTHGGSYMGVEATGRKVSFEVAAFFDFEHKNGAVTMLGERVYYDNGGILSQMKGESTKVAGVGLIARAAGSVAGPAPVASSKLPALLAAQRALTDRHIELENQHDWTAVGATFTGDGRSFFDAVPLGANLTGAAGVAGAYAMLSGAVPDLKTEVLAAHEVPGCSIRELRLSGRSTGEYGGVRGTDQPVSFRAAVFLFYDVMGDKPVLIGERVYYDNVTVLTQIQAAAKG